MLNIDPNRFVASFNTLKKIYLALINNNTLARKSLSMEFFKKFYEYL